MACSWLKLTSACITGSVILQLFCVVTPGWLILKGPLVTAYHGLIYIVFREDNRTFRVQSVPEFNQIQEGYKGAILYNFVSSLIKVLIGLLVCVATMIMKLMALRTHIWTDTATLICVLALAIANTLQWDLFSHYVNISVNVSPFVQNMTSLMPWSLVTYGVASILTSVVLMTHFVFFVKEHIQPLIENFAALD